MHHFDLLFVAVLKTQGVAALEERIVRSGGFQVADLVVIGDSRAELAGVEIAVADTVQGVRIGSNGGVHGPVDITEEGLPCLVILFLREETVALEVLRHVIVLGPLGVGAIEECLQVGLRSLVVPQAIVGFRTEIIGLCGVLRTLRVMLDHFGHPIDGLLHLPLQEMVRTELVAEVLLGLDHLRRGVRYRIQHRDSRCVVLALHERITEQTVDLPFVFRTREAVQEIIESPHGLSECAGRLIGAERVVIRRLFRHCGSQTEGCGCLIGQLRLLGLLELHVGVTHGETGCLGQGVLLALDLLEVLHCIAVVAQLVLRRTQHIQVVAHEVLFVGHRRFVVEAQMLRCLTVIALHVVHLA